jgi:hypothetical protein
MLIRLTSSTSGDMILLGEHAHVLFGWIGKECTARGVFTVMQLPEAIAGLRRGVDEEKQAIERKAPKKVREAQGSEGRENEEECVTVTLGQRAQPLIRLLERTLKEGGFVLWEAPGDF